MLRGVQDIIREERKLLLHVLSYKEAEDHLSMLAGG